MAEPLLSLLIAALIAAIGLLIFWPERGFYWRWREAQQMTERIHIEHALKFIHEREMEGHTPLTDDVASALQITAGQATNLLAKMAARDLIAQDEGHIRLTTQGRDYALHIIRAHRLWERFLADQTGYPEPEWHTQAHRQEHLLTRKDLDALSSQLGNPIHDPHGDPIPTADGRIIPHGGRPLVELDVDTMARIVHLEDEPVSVYAQLVAERLHPGMRLRVIERSPQRVRFWADGDEHVLAPVVASNISVVPLSNGQDAAPPPPTERLTRLKPGEKARVVHISPACPRHERRRLMDLGIIPGTLIEAEMTSPSGDPTAYRVRGALVALRHAQADLIRITPQEEVVS